MMRHKLFVMIGVLAASGAAQAQSWQEEKGDHFFLKFPPGLSAPWAEDVLRFADGYYDSIARTIDYARFNNYWSWDDRVEIVVYPDRDSFLKGTGQPDWSQGGAIHRSGAYVQRRIVTFYQEENFIDGLLPHEISHLMLLDFIGADRSIPIWFNEGVAQLHEKGKIERSDELMRVLAGRGQFIPLDELMRLDIRQETQELRVGIFYAQSVSIVNFMITRFGSRRFGVLCRSMREGKGFEESLRSAYPANISTLSELEKNWLSYMKRP